jgi:integrase
MSGIKRTEEIMKVAKDKKGRWFYDFYFGSHVHDGATLPTRYRVITGLSRADTEKAMHEKLERLKKEKHGILENVPVQKPVLFEDFAVNTFLEGCRTSKRRPKTVQSLENSVNNHLAPFFKGKTLQDITPELVDRYRAARCEEKPRPSPASVNREISALKSICRLAVRYKRIKEDPTAGLEKFEEPRGKDRILTDEETGRLVAAAGGVLRPFLIIALNTGMRRNEILSLKWTNINLGKKLITIEAENSKSRKSRVIPMNAPVLEALRSMPRGSAFVFFNSETGASIRDVKTSFRTACRKAKITGLTIHSLRHSAATRMIEAGVDIVTVSKILGHASLEMTLRYAHPRFEAMQLAVEKLGMIFTNQAQVGNKLESKHDKAEVKTHESSLSAYN